MKLLLAAIGKAKASPERALCEHYAKRLPWNLTFKELESKQSEPFKRRAHEAELLLNACAGYDRLIALDEQGKNLSSQEFASQLSIWQQQGNSSFAFVIGGADGLDASVIRAAHLVWSFGRVTWPHMLVRGLLAEQLYRSYSVLTNHPYHRS
jgi:23S rRNA (pseudouridine1915-N3)-methyltransferase